jgi:chemotaxis signal transduction protein
MLFDLSSLTARNTGLRLINERKSDSEAYSVETGCVDEVRPLWHLSALPCVPPFVVGIVCSRDRIVSVVKRKCIFGLSNDAGNHGYVVVIGHGVREINQLRDHGAITAAQDQSSCAVIGMSEEAIRLGAPHVLPLERSATHWHESP